jgi:GTP diphosphokinase / guanosine-3',5'-bis(diphosphate) 3'-diphosphatase
VAESGIAAHWKYKEHAGEGSAQQERARSWLTHLVQMQESGNSEEFIESVKVDLFPDKVYVFTPRGEILRLPRGATVVDFAYAVHTDIGNRCVAAKVDRRLTPLRTVLRNGQTVHIITAKGARPNPAWVNFVVTAKARSGIRHYLKSLKSHEAVELGRRLLQQALAEFHVDLDGVEPATLTAALGEFALHTAEELYEKIGLGERLAPLVARRLLPGDHLQAHDGKAAPLEVAGAEGLLVTYAHCCYPLPGDPILAFLSTGRGIVIHRETCANVTDYRKHPENWLPVNWQASDGRFFDAEIRVEAANRMGLLAAVSAAISGTRTNITSVNFQHDESETATMTFMIEVSDREHLARVIRTVRRMSDVMRVVRTIAGQNRKRDPAPP